MNDKIKENLLDQSCAPTDNLQSNWDRIDWTKAEQAVKKLQARIVKAQKEGRHNKVKALQVVDAAHHVYAVDKFHEVDGIARPLKKAGGGFCCVVGGY